MIGKNLLLQKCKIICIMFLLIVCSIAQAQDSTPFTVAEREAIASSVVQLVVSGDNPRQGSGVIVSPEGVIFTNAHVVEGADQIRVAVFDGFRSTPELRYSARIRWISEDDNFDFAVLEINGDGNGRSVNTSNLNLPYIRAWNDEVDIMDDVYFFTYQTTGNNYMVITTGTVTTIQTRPINRQNRLIIQSDADFSTGGSGGLVVNRNGEFIGIPWEVTRDAGQGGYLTDILPLETICAVRSSECDIEPPSPTRTPTRIPTSTPTRLSTSVPTCPGLPGAIISKGERAQIAYYGTSNNLRISPDTNSRLITQIVAGIKFDVIDGPVCADGYRWWKVELDNGTTGWTTDGDQDDRWIEPPSTLDANTICPGLPTAIVTVGIRAMVTPGPNNNVRGGPTTEAGLVTEITPGTRFTITDGPVCADGFRWWQIRLAGDTYGWTADGDRHDRWIEPTS